MAFMLTTTHFSNRGQRSQSKDHQDTCFKRKNIFTHAQSLTFDPHMQNTVFVFKMGEFLALYVQIGILPFYSDVTNVLYSTVSRVSPMVMSPLSCLCCPSSATNLLLGTVRSGPGCVDICSHASLQRRTGNRGKDEHSGRLHWLLVLCVCANGEEGGWGIVL